MKRLAVLVALSAAPTLALAQDAIPDLKGTWSGPFKTIVYGHNPHHPGSETMTDPPRVREIGFTFEIEGQDGPLLWGHSWSDPERKEPFAATLTADGTTIIGADTDGAFNITLVSPDRMNFCYTHPGLSPSHSIVASCGVVDRPN